MKKFLLIQPNRLLRKFYSKAIWRLEKSGKSIFLTFDDGPIPGLTEWILDELAKHQAKATFFCVGENIIKHPEIFKRIVAEGHAVANHTYTHLKGFHSDLQEYMDNVSKCESLTRTKLFRPPYGQLRKSQYKKLIEAGYKVIFWDVISYDYEKIPKETCLKIVIERGRNGSVVLFHDNIKAEENIRYTLPRFISLFKKRGYRFEAIVP